MPTKQELENPNQPLRKETRDFLQEYRQSPEFGFYEGNLSLSGSMNHLNDYGKRGALWSRAFVDRLFSIETRGDADVLLDPWIRWREAFAKIMSTDESYQKQNARFNKLDIPSEIKAYQGNLTDNQLRGKAEFELFRLTGSVRQAIDLIEGVPKPVSLDVIFMVQRVVKQTYFPSGGLPEYVIKKPDIKRVEADGKSYAVFYDSADPLSTAGYSDSASEEIWTRWNQVEVGKRVRYLVRDEKTGNATVGSGIVEGFDLMGAGDAMLFGPSVSLVGIILRRDGDRFITHSPLRGLRLETEEISEKDLKPPKRRR